MKNIFKKTLKILLIVVLILAVAILSYYMYWRNSKTINTFTYFSEPTEIVYSDLIWKSDSIQDMLFDKAFLFVPIKIEGIEQQLYMQFDTGIPETNLYGITLNELLKGNKVLKASYTKDSIQFLNNPTLNMDGIQFKTDKLKMLARGTTEIDTSFIVIGSLGLDAIVGRTLLLDFKNNKIAITEKSINSFGKQLIEVEGASVNQFPLLIPAKIGQKSVRLFYDSGSSMFSLLTSEKRLAALQSESSIEKLCCIGSGGKDYEIFRKQINENIQIGNTIRKAEYVYGFFRLNVMDYLPQSFLYGITGNTMFDNQFLIIDMKNNVMAIAE